MTGCCYNDFKKLVHTLDRYISGVKEQNFHFRFLDIGITVSNLEESAGFFTSLLGWKEIQRLEDYPAIFVSDGQIVLTLWATKEEPIGEFNKNKNVGLHHIAFAVADEEILNRLHQRLKESGIKIEFAPELLGPGPAKHMMCYEPSGIRVEFTWAGN